MFHVKLVQVVFDWIAASDILMRQIRKAINKNTVLVVLIIFKVCCG